MDDRALGNPLGNPLGLARKKGESAVVSEREINLSFGEEAPQDRTHPIDPPINPVQTIVRFEQTIKQIDGGAGLRAYFMSLDPDAIKLRSGNSSNHVKVSLTELAPSKRVHKVLVSLPAASSGLQEATFSLPGAVDPDTSTVEVVLLSHSSVTLTATIISPTQVKVFYQYSSSLFAQPILIQVVDGGIR